MSSSATKPTSAAAGILLKADAIALKYRDELVTQLGAHIPRRPKLVGILATAAAPSRTYAEFTQQVCNELGVEFVLRRTGAALEHGAAPGDGAEDAIIEANEDAGVDGVMVYYPIYGGRQDQYLQQVVSPLKDVEGLHFQFHYNLYHNIRYIAPRALLAPPPGALPDAPPAATPPPGTAKSILPCTPLAIVKTLEYVGVYNALLSYGDRAFGRTVTVINRSEVVGRPLAALLANDGARVFSVDIDGVQEYTRRPRGGGARAPRHAVQPCALTLEACLALSDVVVSAVPDVAYKVPTHWLKDGAVCINVAAERNFEKDVREKASIYVPAVGKVTIMMLLRNLLRLQQYSELMRSD